MALPQLTGIARLIADPELRFSGSGVAVCSMRLVFASRKQDSSGTWVDGDELFIKATAFKDLAEHCAESLTRGCEVVVTGRVKTESWTGKDGQPRSAPALLVDSIGPSLRWDVVKVSRAQRASNGHGAESAEGPQQDQGAEESPPF